MLYARIGCAVILAFVAAQIAPHKKRHNRARIGGGRKRLFSVFNVRGIFKGQARFQILP